MQDPKYGVFLPARSFGQFGIQIEDSKKFLLKLVGTLPVFDKANLVKYFRGFYTTRIKDVISTYLIRQGISVLEINAYLDEISAYMKERLEPLLREYGIKLVNFYVNDINVPENDPAAKSLKSALSKRAEMNIIGYNYQQERSFDTLEGAAKNQGSTASGLMGGGLGLGMGVAVGGQFGGISNVLNVAGDSGKKKECPQCHAMLGVDTRFCGDCGYDTTKAAKGEAPTIQCFSCGAKLSPTAKFCPECGKKSYHCPTCGADRENDAAACPVCGYEVPQPCPSCGKPLEGQNLKFCPECGTSLLKKCRKCSTQHAGHPKFCPECGEKIGARALRRKKEN